MTSRHAALALPLLAAALVTPLAAGPSSASTADLRAPARIGSGSSSTYSVVSHTVTHKAVNHRNLLAYCAGDGTMCSFETSRTATRIIQTSLGMTVKAVAADIHISSERSQTVTIGCSRKVPRGYALAVYPRGDRHRYKIKRKTLFWPSNATTTTYSSYKYAFNPYPSGISCELERVP